VYTQPFQTTDVKATEDFAKARGHVGTALVHGNLASGLEPMVKGNKLGDHLSHIQSSITDLQSSMLFAQKEIAYLTLNAGSHFHLNAPVGPTSPSPTGMIMALTSGPTQVKSAIDNVVGAINNIIREISGQDPFVSSWRSSYHWLN
jgi:hypothetical protein